MVPKTMRIVYLVTTLAIGGAERQAIALAERMEERGHIVAVLVLKPRAAEEWPAAVQVFYLGMKRTPSGFLSAFANGRRFLRGFRPDLVHSHTFHSNIVARLLKLFARVPAVISTVHNVYEGGSRRMLAYRLTASLSDRTIAVSHAAAERYLRLKAVRRRKCLVISNGIDTNEFVPSFERRAQMRDEMGAGQEFIWLAAGRIVPAKDYPNLLRAFAQVVAVGPEQLDPPQMLGAPSLARLCFCAKRGKPVLSTSLIHGEARLWVAGAGDTNEDSDLIALCRGLGLSGSVRWLGLRRDLPALLDACDGFVLASAWEGMPLAVGEAMAMEKPVVVTDVGGVRELVGEWRRDRSGLKTPRTLALGDARGPDGDHPRSPRLSLGRAARERTSAPSAWTPKPR